MKNCLFTCLLAICCISASTFISCTNSTTDNKNTKQKKQTVYTRTIATANLPNECTGQGNCDNATCLDTIRIIHEILPDTFTAMRGYYSSTMYDGKSYPISEISPLIIAASQYCSHYKIALQDISGSEDNAHITFSTQITGDDGSTECEEIINVSYSVALFKSLLTHYTEADNIVFYKAAHSNGIKDIIFTVNVGSDAVYYGNVSGLEP